MAGESFSICDYYSYNVNENIFFGFSSKSFKDLIWLKFNLFLLKLDCFDLAVFSSKKDTWNF